MEIEWKDSELSQKEIDSIDIEIESREGLLAGNLGNMKTKMEGNLSFLVGTIHSETYEEDKYKITIKFNDKQDVIIFAYKTLIFNEGVIWWKRLFSKAKMK